MVGLIVWPGYFWTYMSCGPHGYTHQTLVPLAQQNEHNSDAICCLFCPSVLAASTLPSLVMYKGHSLVEVPKFPLVIEDKVKGYKKTKEVVLLLKNPQAWNNVKKVYASQRMTAGKGESRNCRHIQCKGPCIIYNEDNSIIKAFRNIPGITLLNISKLNFLKLAPGGHVAMSAFGLTARSTNR